MKKSVVTLSLGMLFFVTVFSTNAFGQQSCPVMEDAYWSLQRAGMNLTHTRFGSTAEIKASQILVEVATAEILSAMDRQDCSRSSSNPLPQLNIGSYRGNCPVVQSTKNFVTRALADFRGVRRIFRPAVQHPKALLNEALNLLSVLSEHVNCK